MLTITNIGAGYGQAQVLRNVSLSVKPGEILCLLGRNGAGKTTIMKTIMGLVPLYSGSIRLGEKEIGGLQPHEMPHHGIGYIPQGRRLFTELSVEENLQVGLLTNKDGKREHERVLEIFPLLKERLKQQAGTLSGGEQQMLATARALCINPQILLLDEPTEGLQPSMIELIRQVVVRMKQENVAVILVEQRVEAVLSIADNVTFIENGHSRETVTAASLQKDTTLLTRYVGV